VRLDELLVARGLAASRAEAARLILAGRVRAAGAPADKAGRRLPDDAPVELVQVSPYVGRGGEKLAGALAALGVAVAGRVCLDVGASTGGFTDCLLAHGARLVYAVDVGHGQLHPRLRGDPRVVVLERVNARHLDPARFAVRPTLATVDVSFVSLGKVLPAVAACLADPGEIVALVKPQFEVGRALVGKGGVVRDPARHAEAIRGVAASAGGIGLQVAGVVASALRGPKGNREFFVLLARVLAGRVGLGAAALEAAIARAVGGEGPGPDAGGTR
jgi:23S rRNA (cytidine1920-2'-O)/16S rRNA (cytidine1409-2'-O)-methyltransferase